MQHQPNRRPLAWLTGSLLIVVAVGVVWGMLAGIGGYTLGNPPTGLNAVADCYHVTHVDFIVPMWKPADVADCAAQTSSAPAQTDPAPMVPACPRPDEYWGTTPSAPDETCIPTQ
jgi:hypothetical protein